MVAELFVAGRFERTPLTAEIRAPWDHSLIAEVSLAHEHTVERAIEHARNAVAPLRSMPTHARRALLAAIADGLREKSETFATLIAREAAKPIALARAEVRRAESTFRLASEECARLGGEALALDLNPGLDGLVGAWTRVGSGALLAITPFNFPLNLVAHKLAPAFALAMPVVLKPAPQTPLTALALASLVAEAGAPAGLLSVIPTSNELAARMVEDERFAAVSFTGSAQVGWAIKSRAGKKRALLELGGNAAAIVAPDADALAAIERIFSPAFAYAGQVCIKTQRVFVPRTQYQAFVDAIVARTRALEVRDPLDEAALMGPLIDRRAAERVRSWIDEAVAKGASLLCGGALTDNRLTPAIVIDAAEGTQLVDEELFGPALIVHGYDDLSHAIASIERGRYGLQTALFTNDTRTIRRCFHELTTGALIVNEGTNFRVDSMPYGGVKDSGLGREGVRFAIDELSDKKLLVVR
ncbi:MAG: aldehyde dehydrogenase family protein [Polyangiales bacterium]